MAQITSGLRSLLSHPLLYRWLQNLLGANHLRRVVTEQAIQPRAGMRVLDIGCGPADLLDFLGEVEYWGFDESPHYIESARRRFGSRGQFFCQRFGAESSLTLGPFDRVLAFGILHHLDEQPAARLFQVAHQVLAPGGRLVTIDPCYHPDQSWLARWFISRDRGQSVRTPQGYAQLAQPCFGPVNLQVRHDLARIPYSHCILTAHKETP